MEQKRSLKQTRFLSRLTTPPPYKMT